MKGGRLLTIFLFLELVVLASCAYKSQLLYQPNSILITGQKDTEPIRLAIRRALLEREWRVTHDEPGVIEAKQTKSAFWASIRVTYDTQSAQVRYLDSQGLNYSNTGGEERIHAHYNLWARNVEKDLVKALQGL